MMLFGPRQTKSYWEKQATRYEVAVQTLCPDFENLIADVRELVPKGTKVFEAGCGTGLFTMALADRASWIIATDISKAMLNIARKRLSEQRIGNVQLSEIDAMEIVSFKCPFDVVICANVLHLMQDPEAFLRRALSKLKPGGQIIAPTFLHAEDIIARVASSILGLSGFPLKTCFNHRSFQALFANLDVKIEVSRKYKGTIPVYLISVRKESA